MRVLAAFFCLLSARIVNLLLPIQYKILIDSLSASSPSIFLHLLFFCLLRLLQGSGGVISSIQAILWIPITQFNTRQINIQLLNHLHYQSLSFHIHKKTGEVIRVMDRGTSSISSLLNSILFNIFPVFIDIIVAVVYFCLMFDLFTGVIVLVTLVAYILVTIIITEWRTKFRREMNELDSISRARAVDSLLNFETVKYFNNEKYEVKRFEESIINYHVADYKSSASLIFLNSVQSLVIVLGLSFGWYFFLYFSLVCIDRVRQKTLSVGDFILFVTYVIQLYQPLNFFGTYYRMIQQNFIDMESMFELLDEDSSVKDIPEAKNLICEHENVSFGYGNGQGALFDVSFKVPAYSKTAIVGQTGSGKSTLIRLLFRFYDPNVGRILIDGNDISQVTQYSLRDSIGVVPQDSICFNDTIGYNIGYGDPLKSFSDIESAARSAQIHDKIMTFPDGYQTRVGERGLRLSGGEKQRVAIARMLLKDPKIMLLDEATSALDNTTEEVMKKAFKDIGKKRTSLVVAHRLSTITDSDNIIVLKDGRIVEQGKHTDLLKKKGSYFDMWTSQLKDNEVGQG